MNDQPWPDVQCSPAVIRVLWVFLSRSGCPRSDKWRRPFICWLFVPARKFAVKCILYSVMPQSLSRPGKRLQELESAEEIPHYVLPTPMEVGGRKSTLHRLAFSLV
ncbi:hypothetical protein JTE90_021580 [Oedothorax gibbosus]|uniref:Uncharacterized protein n=1 Tax=Oedothorax gibbosus TaxID=931172 RepID=A0AAV6VRE8_9ARAC|nr:hypothetical protein JTE90_021580 [Oedothorax gibbosus]